MGTVCAVGEAELTFITFLISSINVQTRTPPRCGAAAASHLDVVGGSDQLIDVGSLRTQLGRVVLQDDAFAGAAVQTAGGLLCT